MKKILLATIITATIATAQAASTATILGNGAKANDDHSTAIGVLAEASANDSVAIGSTSKATVHHSTAVGSLAEAKGMGSSALGSMAKATSDYSTAVGIGSEASAGNTVAIGGAAKATKHHGTAVGVLAEASAVDTTALGSSAKATGDNGVAVGNASQVSGKDSIAVGAIAKASELHTVAVGATAQSSAAYSTAIGGGAIASGERSTALGAATIAETPMSVAIGGGSAVLKSDVTEDGGAVASIGNSDHNFNRRLTGVSNGVKDNDAATVAQLDKVHDHIKQVQMDWKDTNDQVLIHNDDIKDLNAKLNNIANASNTAALRADVERLDEKVNKNNKEARQGTASAIAMANIPQVVTGGTKSIGAAVGSYKGQSAIAIGVSAMTPNNKWIFKGSVSATKKGGVGFGAGASYVW